MCDNNTQRVKITLENKIMIKVGELKQSCLTSDHKRDKYVKL